MISFRIREFGAEDWTDLFFDGELEESVAEALLGALAEFEHYHIQRREGDDWLEDFALGEPQ